MLYDLRGPQPGSLSAVFIGFCERLGIPPLCGLGRRRSAYSDTVRPCCLVEQVNDKNADLIRQYRGPPDRVDSFRLCSLGPLPREYWCAVAGTLRLFPSIREVHFNQVFLGPEELAALDLHLLPRLLNLELFHCGLRDAHAFALAEMLSRSNSLCHLKVSDNRITRRGLGYILRVMVRKPNARTLHIGGNPVDEPGVLDLCGALSRSTVTSLGIRDLQLSHQSVRSICGLLARPDCRLNDLQLRKNALSDADVEALAAAVTGNGTLRVLELQDCGITPRGMASLARALATCSSLQSLHLSGNPLGDAGCAAVAGVLNSCDQLATLAMSGCGITAEGAQALAALRPRRALSGLSMGQNPLGDRGFTALLRGLVHTRVYFLDLRESGLGPDSLAALRRLQDGMLDSLAAPAARRPYAPEDCNPRTGMPFFLKHVDLSGNALGDAGAAQLAGLLARNATILRLTVMDCAIGRAGGVALERAIAANRTLTVFNCGGQRKQANKIARASRDAIERRLAENAELQAAEALQQAARGAELLQLESPPDPAPEPALRPRPDPAPPWGDEGTYFSLVFFDVLRERGMLWGPDGERGGEKGGESGERGGEDGGEGVGEGMAAPQVRPTILPAAEPAMGPEADSDAELADDSETDSEGRPPSGAEGALPPRPENGSGNEGDLGRGPSCDMDDDLEFGLYYDEEEALEWSSWDDEEYAQEDWGSADFDYGLDDYSEGDFDDDFDEDFEDEFDEEFGDFGDDLEDYLEYDLQADLEGVEEWALEGDLEGAPGAPGEVQGEDELDDLAVLDPAGDFGEYFAEDFDPEADVLPEGALGAVSDAPPADDHAEMSPPVASGLAAAPDSTFGAAGAPERGGAEAEEAGRAGELGEEPGEDHGADPSAVPGAASPLDGEEPGGQADTELDPELPRGFPRARPDREPLAGRALRAAKARARLITHSWRFADSCLMCYGGRGNEALAAGPDVDLCVSPGAFALAEIPFEGEAGEGGWPGAEGWPGEEAWAAEAGGAALGGPEASGVPQEVVRGAAEGVAVPDTPVASGSAEKPGAPRGVTLGPLLSGRIGGAGDSVDAVEAVEAVETPYLLAPLPYHPLSAPLGLALGLPLGLQGAQSGFPTASQLASPLTSALASPAASPPDSQAEELPDALLAALAQRPQEPALPAAAAPAPEEPDSEVWWAQGPSEAHEASEEQEAQEEEAEVSQILFEIALLWESEEFTEEGAEEADAQGVQAAQGVAGVAGAEEMGGRMYPAAPEEIAWEALGSAEDYARGGAAGGALETPADRAASAAPEGAEGPGGALEDASGETPGGFYHGIPEGLPDGLQDGLRDGLPGDFPEGAIAAAWAGWAGAQASPQAAAWAPAPPPAQGAAADPPEAPREGEEGRGARWRRRQLGRRGERPLRGGSDEPPGALWGSEAAEDSGGPGVSSWSDGPAVAPGLALRLPGARGEARRPEGPSRPLTQLRHYGGRRRRRALPPSPPADPGAGGPEGAEAPAPARPGAREDARGPGGPGGPDPAPRAEPPAPDWPWQGAAAWRAPHPRPSEPEACHEGGSGGPRPGAGGGAVARVAEHIGPLLEAHSEPQVEPQFESQPEPQAELQAEPQAELQAEPQAEAQFEPQTGPPAEPKPESRLETRAEHSGPPDPYSDPHPEHASKLASWARPDPHSRPGSHSEPCSESLDFAVLAASPAAAPDSLAGPPPRPGTASGVWGRMDAAVADAYGLFCELSDPGAPAPRRGGASGGPCFPSFAEPEPGPERDTILSSAASDGGSHSALTPEPSRLSRSSSGVFSVAPRGPRGPRGGLGAWGLFPAVPTALSCQPAPPRAAEAAPAAPAAPAVAAASAAARPRPQGPGPN